MRRNPKIECENRPHTLFRGLFRFREVLNIFHLFEGTNQTKGEDHGF